MKLRRSQLVLLAIVGVWIGATAGPVRAFILGPNDDPWLSTASGPRSGKGDSATLTWSLVRDGRNVPSNTSGSLGPSDLISFLDTEFGVDPNEPDFEQRPWFPIFADAFGRWSELSGVNYLYEPNDDNAAHANSNGVLGVRGDMRIAGADIDGSGGTLAFNYYPDDGDMVLDTAESSLFGNSADNFLYFRNTIMHEMGHGFGIDHVSSNSDALLLESSINTSFDGPQLDEVRAIQYYFGDANEKSNGGQGNDEAGHATSLGPIADGGSASVGSDADVPSQFIQPTAIDFVSLANENDTDFYSFSISDASELDITLTPRGGKFKQNSPGLFDASARVNLVFEVFDTDGTTPLALVNDVGKGFIESLADLSLPAAGEYFIRIGSVEDDTIQLYELELSVTSTATYLEADFDTDGDVDGADLSIWELAMGATDLGDTDDDGDSDGADFLTWQRQYTGPLGGLSPSTTTVPEPTTALLLLSGALSLVFRKRNMLLSRSR